MKIKQRDIVLLSYPFSDLIRKKVRPAVVLSNNNYNKSSDCLLAPLTSVLKDFPYSILINESELESGELIKISRIRVDKLFNVEKKLIFKKLGVLNNKTFKKVKKEFESLV